MDTKCYGLKAEQRIPCRPAIAHRSLVVHAMSPPLPFTDWLPTDVVPTLGPSRERVSIRNDVLQLDYEVDIAYGSRVVVRRWTLVHAHRLMEATRYGMPTTGKVDCAVHDANAQIRELLAEGRRMAGSMGAWVLVEGGHGR
jgi:hypothetical protein